MEKKDQVPNPRELRAQLDQHIGNLRAELTKLGEQQSDAERQRDAILSQPVGVAALVTRAHASIDAVADNYMRRIAETVGATFKRPPTVADMMHEFTPGSASLYIPLRGSSSFLGDYNDEPLSQEAATFLFRDAMKAAAESAIRAATLNADTLSGVDMDDARKRLAELDSKLAKINAKIEAKRAELAELTGTGAAD